MVKPCDDDRSARPAPRRRRVNNAGHASRRRRSPRFLRLARRADGGAASCARRELARPHRRRHARARLRLRHALSRRDRDGGAGARLHAGRAGGDRLAAERRLRRLGDGAGGGGFAAASRFLDRPRHPRPRARNVRPPECADGGASPRADRAAGGSSSSCRTGRGRGRAPTSRPSASAGPIRAGSSGSLFAEVGFEAETWTTALHMAPASWRPLLGAARALRPDRAARLAGLRRRDRRLGGEAHGAGDHGPRASHGSARRFARRSAHRPARSGERLHRRESRKIAWSARKFHSGRRTERFSTRPLP